MQNAKAPISRSQLTLVLVVLLIVFLFSLPPWGPAHATTYTVTNTDDSGAGSLRAAIDLANTNPGPDTIAFNIPGTDPNCVAGVCTITLVTPLPWLYGGGTVIDGYPNMGATYASGSTPASLKIVLDGGTNSINYGIEITSADNEIKGLVINGFTQRGIYIHGVGASGNVVSGNHIGTDVAGTAAVGNGSGVYISYGAWGNTIGGDTDAERNVISGNTNDGITLVGGTFNPHDNTIEGNWIGIQSTGDDALANAGNGVQMLTSANSNIIGPNNVISGNTQTGIQIWNGATGNAIKGNFIGTDRTGTAAIPNEASNGGIYIQAAAQGTVIGGDTPAERNIISGNTGKGILISGAGTDFTVVSGNIIGLDVNGTTALLNGWEGVYVRLGAANTTIGGTTSGEGNVIVADYAPVKLDTNAHNNTVSGNLLGTDITGTSGFGTGTGVAISGGANTNTIGGTTIGERNVISGNGGRGINISGLNTDDNHVLGNFIGVDITGANPLPNPSGGIQIWDSAQDNIIGPGNIIANNGLEGIRIYGADTDRNFITQNSIYAHTNYNIALPFVPDGSNEDITAPTIVSVSLSPLSASGTTTPACSGCKIEVFTSPAPSFPGAGKSYLGTGTTDGSGNWTVSTPGLHGPYISATLTDAAKGTSMFSNRIFTTIQSLYLPLIMR